MSKEIQVVAWDDIHLAEGAKVQATHVDVPFRFGTVEGELDLTDEHFDQAVELFRQLFGAVLARTQREDQQEKKKARNSPARRQVISPLDQLCPFPVGTPERRDWLKGLRWWAGETGLLTAITKSGSENGTEYHYTKPVLEGYIAFLAKEAQKQAS